MWLLNTHTAELRFFTNPKSVGERYAILSHVWGMPSEEDTFQTVRDAYEQCRRNELSNSEAASSQSVGVDPRDSLIASLSSQVQDLTSRHEELVAALLKRDPSLVSLLPSHDSPSHPSRPDAPTSYPPQHAHTKALPTDARDCLSTKIRNFLHLAEEHGLDWAWADTCCIDKTNSAELIEAVNSMFEYYSHSYVCYVYLSDVPPFENRTFWEIQFRRSKWHSRGWTLQELIAPKTLIFMAKDWTRIGTKSELSSVLEQIENMPPTSILQFEKDFSEASVAQRMSWASRRRTTRVEDEAYCLMGLFGIHMPTLYGEGRNAFYRLQEAIMNTSSDISLLAWTVEPSPLQHRRLRFHTPFVNIKGDLTSILTLLKMPRPFDEPLNHHLLAPSPDQFASAGDIVSIGNARQRWNNVGGIRVISAPCFYLNICSIQ